MTYPASRPYIMMLGGSFAFTIMAEFAQVLNRDCDWQVVAIARSLLVALFAAVLVAVSGTKLVFFKPWRLWVRSVAGSLSMLGTFYAFRRLPAADVLTLTNTYPVWVAVLSWPLYRIAPGAKMWLAIGAAVVGMILVEQPHLESGNLGVFVALVAAIFTAVAMLGLHAVGDIDPRSIVVHFSSVACVFCVVAFFALPRDRTPDQLGNAANLIMLLCLGMAATVGQLFLTLAFGRGNPSRVSVVGLTQIVFGLAFDVWLWNRQLNAASIVGTILVIAPTGWLLIRSQGRTTHLKAAADVA